MVSNLAAKLIIGTLTVESYLNALYANRAHPVRAPSLFYFVSNLWYSYFIVKTLLLQEA